MSIGSLSTPISDLIPFIFAVGDCFPEARFPHVFIVIVVPVGLGAVFVFNADGGVGIFHIGLGSWCSSCTLQTLQVTWSPKRTKMKMRAF